MSGAGARDSRSPKGETAARAATAASLLHEQVSPELVGGRRDWSFVLRHGFVYAGAGAAVGTTPLTRLMGPSRGWMTGLRARAYLLLLWLATVRDVQGGRPVRLDTQRRQLAATALGTTATRFNAAIRQLEQTSFVEIRPTAGGGRAVDVRVLSEMATGAPYRLPTQDGEWFAIGSDFFRLGWASKLSGAGLLVLLAAARQANWQKEYPSVWVATTRTHAWYGVSPAVWTRGVVELAEFDLIRRTWEPPPAQVSNRDPGSPPPRRRSTFIVVRRHRWLNPYNRGRRRPPRPSGS